MVSDGKVTTVMQGNIYAISMSEGLFKIGVSREIVRRVSLLLRSFEGFNPSKVLTWTVDEPYEFEKVIHDSLSDYHYSFTVDFDGSHEFYKVSETKLKKCINGLISKGKMKLEEKPLICGCKEAKCGDALYLNMFGQKHANGKYRSGFPGIIFGVADRPNDLNKFRNLSMDLSFYVLDDHMHSKKYYEVRIDWYTFVGLEPFYPIKNRSAEWYEHGRNLGHLEHMINRIIRKYVLRRKTVDFLINTLEDGNETITLLDLVKLLRKDNLKAYNGIHLLPRCKDLSLLYETIGLKRI